MLLRAKHWIKGEGAWIAPGEVFSFDADDIGELSEMTELVEDNTSSADIESEVVDGSVKAEPLPESDPAEPAEAEEQKTGEPEPPAPKPRKRKTTNK